MLLLHEGHMYFVCGPGVLSMFPARVSSVRRAHRTSKPLAHVAVERGRLAEKNDLSEAPARWQGLSFSLEAKYSMSSVSQSWM